MYHPSFAAPGSEWRRLSVITDCLAFVPHGDGKEHRRAKNKYFSKMAAYKVATATHMAKAREQEEFDKAIEEHANILVHM